MMPRLTHILTFLVFSILVHSCTLQHLPKEQTIEPASIPPFKAKGTLALINNQLSTANVETTVSPFTITMNYRNFTDLVLKFLRNAIDKNQLGGTGTKEIKLAIVDVKMLPNAGNFRCVINATVEAGDGYVRGLEAVGASWNYQTAIDSAIANIAVAVLNHERILTYLEQ